MRVTAKRSGWDEPPEGLVTKYDILDPPAWRDDGLSEDIVGELQVIPVPANEYVPAHTVYLVGGQEADAKTIRPATDD
jgi:hypothetical protein